MNPQSSAKQSHSDRSQALPSSAVPSNQPSAKSGSYRASITGARTTTTNSKIAGTNRIPLHHHNIRSPVPVPLTGHCHGYMLHLAGGRSTK